MTVLRAFLMQHRQLSCWLIGAALLIKALIPAGFMPGLSNGMLVLQLCSGQSEQVITVALPGKPGEQGHDQRQKAEMPCAFSGLAAPALAAVDPVLLAIAIALILAMVFRAPARLVLWHGVYLRPPAQGPPAAA